MNSVSAWFRFKPAYTVYTGFHKVSSFTKNFKGHNLPNPVLWE